MHCLGYIYTCYAYMYTDMLVHIRIIAPKYVQLGTDELIVLQN